MVTQRKVFEKPQKCHGRLVHSYTADVLAVLVLNFNDNSLLSLFKAPCTLRWRNLKNGGFTLKIPFTVRRGVFKFLRFEGGFRKAPFW